VHLKDYYNILELSPSATLDEIKKSYRRLAHQYHPDKNENDPYAAAQFAEIKEAYEVLTHPVKKDYYLQQRWYMQSTGKRTGQAVTTPVTILHQMIELDKYSHGLDVHRMDKEGLYNYICTLLSDENIEKLNSFKEAAINKEIVFSAIKSGRLLSWPLAGQLADRLRKIDLDDESVIKKITDYERHARRENYWEKRKVWIVLLIALVLSVSIFLTSRN
jgi:curved DNA-binding protein CbpA